MAKKKGRRFFFPFEMDNSFLSQVMVTSEANRIERGIPYLFVLSASKPSLTVKTAPHFGHSTLAFL